MDFLKNLNINEVNFGVSTGIEWKSSDEYISSYSPVDGKLIAKASICTAVQFEDVIEKATQAFNYWRLIPSPKR